MSDADQIAELERKTLEQIQTQIRELDDMINRTHVLDLVPAISASEYLLSERYSSSGRDESVTAVRVHEQIRHASRSASSIGDKIAVAIFRAGEYRISLSINNFKTNVSRCPCALRTFTVIIAARADSNRRRGKQVMSRLIDSIPRGVPVGLEEIAQLGRTPVAPPQRPRIPQHHSLSNPFTAAQRRTSRTCQCALNTKGRDNTGERCFLGVHR